MIALIAKAQLAVKWSIPSSRILVPNVAKRESTHLAFQWLWQIVDNSLDFDA
jgi:hypothetical protein